MSKRIYSVPQCPKCGHGSSRVVNAVREVRGKFDTVRYRECKECKARFYTGQVNEEVLHKVIWDGWAVAATITRTKTEA